jgi:hypothetical protein
MTKLKILATAILFAGISITSPAQGIMGKLKQKATQAGEKALEKKIDQKTGGNSGSGNSGNSGNTGNTGSNSPTNKGGAGLVVTPPDVKQNISDAEASFKAANYSEARYALKQAMLGIEMEIGQKVLKSLPEKVIGLAKKEDQDQVTSMGAGWVGLTIHRVYADDNDKQLTVNIANNSAWVSAANTYLANSSYATTGGEQNWKQTKVKGYRGIIEYNESSGYKLSVPIGQSSIIVWEGINFASEQEMMNAANAFDIEGLKKTLGEK